MGKSGRAQQAEEENADLRQKKLQESVAGANGHYAPESPLPGLGIHLTAPDGDTTGWGIRVRVLGPCVYRGWRRRLLLSRLPEAGGGGIHTCQSCPY